MHVHLAVPYTDVAAAMLRWATGLGPVEPLAAKRVSLGAATVELRVLGASHQVLVGEFSETVACGLAGGAPVPSQSSDGPYAFASRTERFAAPAYATEVRRLIDTLTGDPAAIVAGFPGSELAVTALRAEQTDGAVSWTTWHAYPQTGELVTTESRLRIQL